MSMSKNEFNEDGFTGVVYTLVCDSSGQKMLDIIARDEDVENAPVTKVSAFWGSDHMGIGSGSHELSGLLSYGPVDTKTEKTSILDISAEENDEGEMEIKVFASPEYDKEV